MMFWDNWTKYWEAALAACAAQPGEPRTSAKGKTLPRLVVASPATPSEIEQVEQNLGLHLPSAFRNVLMQFSRCVDVAWQLPAGFKPPGELRKVTSGGCGWDLNRLAEIDQGRVKMLRAAFPDRSKPYDAVWHNKLAFYEVPNGDYFAIDLATADRAPVVYLSHDDGSGHGYELGVDFVDFIERHSRLGNPGPEDWKWLPFATSPQALLDPDGQAGKVWRGWFGLA